MAISYEEALATLQSMFSDQGYTAHQLDAVLRHHGGHMEHTVETLLSHGEGTPDQLIQKLPGLPPGGVASNGGAGGDAGGASNNSAAHNIDADEELARQLAAEDEREQQQQQRGGRRGVANPPSGGMGLMGAFAPNRQPPGQRRPAASTVTAPKRPAARPAAKPTPPAGTKGRGAPTVLPADFLRIPGRKYPVPSAANNSNNAVSDPIASASGPGGTGQMMTDEQLARMLQDELFQEELRNNPEFSHLAGRRNPRASAAAGGSRVAAGGQTTGRSTYGGGGGVGWGDRTDFFDRLSELGDNAKRRFQDFAASWNDPNAQANRRPLFGGGGGQSTANRGNERRGLLSNDLNMDEEEEEMDFVGGASGGRDFEMNDVGGSAGSGAKLNWGGDKKKD